MATLTDAERDAFLWMQGRMVELLLRHDVQRFGVTFGEQTADHLAHPLLARYRDLAVLFYLRDELFGTILPRIKRRLSFAAPRELLIEDLPPRGRIDWGRTMTASWRDRPGEMPLEVQTRQRRRHFATPENLLTVATLIEYRDAANHLLDAEAANDGVLAIRHPLHEIAEACTRELAFLQFAGLVRDAHAIVDGSASRTIEDLERAVVDNLLPGRNSAYDELLDWRRRLKQLELLDRTAERAPHAMLGANPQRDNYLYQLWLFYELGDLLQRAGRLQSWQLADMRLVFTWGSNGNEDTYFMHHDHGLAQHWHNAPGVRPDLYMARTERDTVRDSDGALIWQAPGYVLDAKYYKPRDSLRAPSSPVKRMLADLQLTGERHGALLFAFQEGAADPPEDDEQERVFEAEPHTRNHLPLYQVKPNHSTRTLVQSDARITIWQIRPRTGADTSIHQTLTALLDRAHAALSMQAAIDCYGFLPDVDTINPGNTQPVRCKTCGELLAFCPKPHISAHHIDRVCPRCDCLRSRQICHIIGRGTYTAPPFVKRVLTRDDLLASIGTLRGWLQANIAPNNNTEPAEQARQTMFRTIGELTETYVKLTRADTAQTEYGLREWIFGRHWSDEHEPRGLPKEVRNMLISGEFVWMQFQSSTIEDWAACAVQYTRALENELHRRLYAPCGLRLVTKDGTPMKPTQFTIGVVLFLYSERKKNTNWDTLLELVARPSGIDELILKQLVLAIDALRLDRNKVAHTEHVDAALAKKIRETVLGTPGQPGLLYRICTALDPPRSSA